MSSFQKAFFQPEAVAVIGASRDPVKIGYAIVENLKQCGFPGRIYPINPQPGEILGLKTYASVLYVPDELDLAVIAIPVPGVAAVLDECGRKGVKGAIIITAGFAEVGGEGRQTERLLVEIAQKYSLRLLGPNCMGIIDTIIPMNASFAGGMPVPGNIAFMSQSGALAEAVLDWACAEGIGLSRFVSLGNKADLTEIDFIRAWGADEHSKVILGYLEDIRDGAEFMALCQQVTRQQGTPIIAIKSGTTAAGTRAVASHTGSLAGSEHAYDAAFKQAGVIHADSVESLFDYSLAFAYQPICRGNRLAIVTNAGGPGILATDAAERAGLRVANLAAATIQRLRDRIPNIASALNPIDVRGDAFEDSYDIALRLALADANVDSVLVILTPQKLTRVEETAWVLAHVVTEMRNCQASSATLEPRESPSASRIHLPSQSKPVLACFMGEAHVKEGIKILQDHGIPHYSFPERAIQALQAMWRYRQWLDRPLASPPQYDFDEAQIKNIFAQARADRRVALAETESHALATAIGLTVPQTELARNREEAVAVARLIGYPVVFKIASPEILHKSDLGGVQVGINNDLEARGAFDRITSRVHRLAPSAQIWGVTVQEMVPPGREVIIGMSRDAQFGPLLMFGLGGIYVEVLKDVVFRIAPINESEARAMINEIHSAPLLRGVRGEKAPDLEAVCQALLRTSQLVSEFPEILELDINPLVVHDQGAIAVDVRLVITSEK
ncbi:MAG: acetate--CoA ligase family protein [Deltaproteobacteria bacterium]|nr:acetate--CoA ligase family protein [Deltaproteobacteria bacterium]MBW1952978.1 acetate--CoA ligase family protein [Deltaproteobacteria bacterium]MBW1985963.1 acetate--CoA ligase family protein [Deltaproteobacteria bacterium]MBW2133723.1 acetate--CoA ligase family protein [Deltaproteobacteria bacterium]